MKLEIIHISDLHVKKPFDSIETIEKIKSSVVFDDEMVCKVVFLCVTGDVAFSAEKRQYDYIEPFFKNLRDELKKNNGIDLKILFVPGNHDVYLSGDSQKRYDKISDAYRNFETNFSEFENLVNEELNINMHSFFEFASKYNLFLSDRMLDEQRFEIDNKTISFKLMNTACFSSKEKNDKDFHYFHCTNQINSQSDYNILLMHHSDQWFSEQCINEVNEIMKDSSFILFGHEHEIDYRIQTKILSFRTGTIDFQKLDGSEFSIFLLDLDNSRIDDYYRVEYDNKEGLFIRHKKDDTFVITTQKIINREKNVIYKNNFFISIDENQFTLDSLFIMPRINIKKGQEIIEISEYDAFVDYVKHNKILCVKGNSRSGKSVLLEKLFLSLISEYKYVLFAADNFIIKSNSEKNLVNLFNEVYPEGNFDEFLQCEKRKKCLIVDKNSSTDDINDFIFYCKNIFDIIVFSDSFYHDNQKKSIEQKLLISEIIEADIQGFTFEQRKELTGKIAQCYNKDINSDIIFKYLNGYVTKEHFWDMTNPEYLTLMLAYLIKNNVYKEKETSKAFSAVYERNLFNKMTKYAGEEDFENTLVLLREIALYIFKKGIKGNESLNLEELVNIYSNSKAEWNVTMTLKNFLNFLTESKIIEERNDEYKFCHPLDYAYFAARGIKHLSQDEKNNSVNELLKNVYYGNYGEILLFIAYSLDSSSFFDKILEIVKEKCGKWDSLSFDSNGHFIIKAYIDFGVQTIRKMESKESFEKRMEENEREREKKEKIKTDDEELDARSKDVVIVVKLLELLAKGVNGYKGIINSKTRKIMLNEIKDNIFKVINFCFDFSKIDYEDFFEIIKEKKNNDSYPKQLHYFVNRLYDFLTTFSLNLCTIIAQSIASKEAMDFVKEIPHYDENGKVIFNNALFKLTCFERYGEQDIFIPYFLEIYEKLSIIQKKIVNRIFNLFIITSPISLANLDKCVSIAELNKTRLLALVHTKEGTK